MSSPLDPAKLKVVELRQELSKRGLDSRGNKAALVKRLKDALEKELKQELPNTSIADTSTEDLDTSQTQEEEPSEEAKEPNEDACPVPIKEKVVTQNSQPVAEKEKVEEEAPCDAKSDQQTNDISEKPHEEKEEEKQEKEEIAPESMEVNEEEPKEPAENNTNENDKEVPEGESRGEKRRHSASAPEKSQRVRSKSPIKEDEPPIDNDKVQLSWYDSDLHLQVDKDSFLAAKPYHEGAFGYAWAGVRATHGVSTGKAWFEVKITEELKWEDFSKCYESREHSSRSRSRDNKHAKEKKEEPPHENGNNNEKTSNVDVEMKEVEKGAKNKPEEVIKDKPEEDAKDKPEEEVKDKPKEDAKDKPKEGTENETNEEPKVEESKEENTEDTKKEEGTEKDEPMKTDEQNSEKEEKPKEEKEPVEPIPTHLFRVGWSILQTGLQLGEENFSYGYESSGKFVVNKTFQDYGIQFGVGDVIASFLNVDEDTIKISFAVNGEAQPEAISVPKSDFPEDFVLFPHVLSRNYAFELNLGNKDSWFVPPDPYKEYSFLEHIDSKVAGPCRPETRSECEVILMCGLPAAGKTHWVKEYLETKQDKKYTVLGSTHLLEKMTVSGDALKNKYRGSWNMLLEKLQKSLNKLIDLAALRRRNYIIDQPNVYPSAQRRKMRPFEGFKRRAVVVVVGDEEQTKRESQQEAQGHKEVPDSILLDMKANMNLPQKGDWLDEVEYVGVEEDEAKQLIQKYNSSARETLSAQRRYTQRDDRHRWQNRRNDYRGGNYRDRNYYNRYDRMPRQGGSWHPPRPGGWNRDRRDVRGPPMGGLREWRPRGNGRDRSRESHSQGNNYNRNRNPPGRGGGNWQQGNWGGNQNWGNNPWQNQGTWGQGGWGNQQPNQNQWKYGGGSNSYSNYSNWNYYGQYAQNWNSQTQPHSTGTTNEYGQYSQDWAQYAQQYAQPDQQTAAVTGQQAQQK